MLILDVTILAGLVIVFVVYRSLQKPTFVTVIWSLAAVTALVNATQLILYRRMLVTDNGESADNAFSIFYLWVTYP